MMVFSPWLIITAITVYMGGQFMLAQIAERRAVAGKSWANNSVIYSLAITGSHFSSWAYYGSVGMVIIHQEVAYFGIMIGIVVPYVLGNTLFRRIIKLKDAYKITSIADFISARYGKSQTIAAIVTTVVITGAMLFIALQLRSVTETFTLVTSISEQSTILSSSIRPIAVITMILFTVIFGMRRLDPTERHPGMVVTMAVDTILKSIACIAIGLFVMLALFGGISGFNEQLSKGFPKLPSSVQMTGSDQILLWVTCFVFGIALSTSVPRKFHMMVVENTDHKHISTAIWMVPLVSWLKEIFLIPIALAGALYCAREIAPDKYLLSLPLQHGQGIISLLVFIGGFSAATGAIVLEVITISTMISNNLLIPIIESNKQLWFLRRHLLLCRWIAAAFLILIASGFEISLAKSIMLSSLGFISTTTLLMPTTVFLMGMFWQRANRIGAILGLTSGTLAWIYLMVVPTLVKAGMISQSIMANGLLGLSFLKPTALFGLTGLPPLTHAILWILIFTIVPYVLGSLLYIPSSEESRLAEEFVGKASTLGYVDQGEANITLSEKEQELEAVLSRYYPASEAAMLIKRCSQAASVADKEQISVVELIELHNEVER
ncbi:MAG: hypothetical protein AB1489_41645, partial [Acidobacteriota bacterium]